MKIRDALPPVLLAANLVLVAWLLFTRPVAVPPHRAIERPPRPAAVTGAGQEAPPPAANVAILLESGDARALATAGLSEDLVRTILLGRALDRLQKHLRDFADTPNLAWQKPKGDQDRDAAIREFDRTLRDIIGVNVDGMLGGGSAYAFLPIEKQMRLRQIERDYDEMEEKLRAEFKGIELPSDAAKLKFLREERDRDLAALLSPEEKRAQQRWTSPSANVVRSLYGEAIQTEEQYNAIYALQKAYDEQWGQSPKTMPPAEWNRARRIASEQLDAEIRHITGDSAWEEASRASDADARQARRLAERLGLPNATPDQIVALRSSYEAQSLRIDDDPTLTMPQRKAQQAALAERAESDLKRILGADAGGALAASMPWVQFLRRGSAFTLDPARAGVPHPVGPVTRSFEILGPPPPPRPKSPGS